MPVSKAVNSFVTFSFFITWRFFTGDKKVGCPLYIPVRYRQTPVYTHSKAAHRYELSTAPCIYLF